MKKITKIAFTVLTAALLFSVTSCADLLSGLLAEEENKKSNSNESESTITYSFKLTDNKVSYYYFTSEQNFSYTKDEVEQPNCVYQISFKPSNSANTAGKWTLYTRPKASVTIIESLADGTYSGGSPLESSSIKLLDSDGNDYQTITTTASGSGDNLAVSFTMDVTKINKDIGAGEAK